MKTSDKIQRNLFHLMFVVWIGVCLASGCHQGPDTILVPKIAQFETEISGLLFSEAIIKSRLDELEQHSHPIVDMEAEIEAIYIGKEIANNRIHKLEKRTTALEEYRGAPEVLISELADRVKALKDKCDGLEFGINITNFRIDDLEEFGHPSKRPLKRIGKHYDKKPTPALKLKATITKVDKKERSIVITRKGGQCCCMRKPSYFSVPPRKRF